MGYLLTVLIIIIVAVVVWFVGNGMANTKDQYASEGGKRFGSILRLGSAVATPILIVVITVISMFTQVPAGHVGLVYTFGGITDQRSDGLQWTAPWQDVRIASIQIQSQKFEKLDSFSSETQDVYVAATINVQVSPENIQNLYREVGPDWFNILVAPRVNQAFKDATVKYTSVEIAPHREEIRRAVADRLTSELKAHSITVQDLLIDNISFSPKFQEAIEDKQANTQLALAERAKVEAEKAKADQVIEAARGTAQSILVNAKAQAEANRELAESVTPELIQYLTVQKLSPNVEVMMIPTGQQFILGADVLKPKP